MKSLIAFLTACCLGFSCFAVCPSMDLTGDCFVDMADFADLAGQWLSGALFEDLTEMALQWLTDGTPNDDFVWIYINDPGVSEHEPFIGYMSKYETTNAQYCQFLNAALAAADIFVDGDYVKGRNGLNPGEDFAGEYYYYLAGPGFYFFDGAVNGGAARINWTGGSFTVDPGFENHPVTYVSWYGAAAFSSYYGWRLPTEWEWQAAADYNGTFTYGCGTSINHSRANYLGSAHPNGTTVVGAFGTYGYGISDMAGNLWEWTSSFWDFSTNLRVIRGGGWADLNSNCTVTARVGYEPSSVFCGTGFRVCR